jgi:hypothetical protein
MNDWSIQCEGPALKPKGKPLNCRKLPSFRAAWKRCEPGRWRSLRSSVSKWDRPGRLEAREGEAKRKYCASNWPTLARLPPNTDSGKGSTSSNNYPRNASRNKK